MLNKLKRTAYGLHALVLSMGWEHIKLEQLSQLFEAKSKNIDFFRSQFLVTMPLTRITLSFSSDLKSCNSWFHFVEAIKKIKVPQIPVTSEPYERFWVEISEFLQGFQTLIFFDMRKLEGDSLLALTQVCVVFEKVCHNLCETTKNQIKISRSEFFKPESSKTISLIYQYLPMVMATFNATLCIKDLLSKRWDVKIDSIKKIYDYLLEQNKSLQDEVFSFEGMQSAQTLLSTLFSNVTIQPLPAITVTEEKKGVVGKAEEEEEVEDEEDEKDIMTRMREGHTGIETEQMIKAGFIVPTTQIESYCEELKNAGNEYLQQFELKINTAINVDKSQLTGYSKKANELKASLSEYL